MELADPPEDVRTLAGRLLAVEAATHALSAWIRATRIHEYASRLEALDSLSEHIHRTTGFLKDPKRSKAARAGVHIAWLAYDFIRIDAEATVAKRSAYFRPGCNQGMAWVGVGMQGLAKGPEWADQDEERLRVYVNAEAHREHLLRMLPITKAMHAEVAAANVFSAIWAGGMLTGSVVMGIERLAAFAARAGGGPIILEVVPSLTGGAALEFVSPVAEAVVLTHSEAITLVAAGTLGADALSLYMMASGLPPKPLDSKAFGQWIERAPKEPQTMNGPEYEYQVRKTGPVEIKLSGGGQQLVVDGARVRDAHLLEAKFVGTPGRSPYIDGSGCPKPVCEAIRKKVINEFKRYAAIISDPSTPAVGLEVIVNDS
ncbi:MAG TPA: restriction endonuclease fold toxin-2 domain-containing protein, partial [Myxococcaceae bacterium]